jgi:hypothetical protein
MPTSIQHGRDQRQAVLTGRVPLTDERQSCTGFLVRGLHGFKERGICLERVMSDNGPGYVSRLFRKACRLLRLRYIRTRPYTP